MSTAVDHTTVANHDKWIAEQLTQQKHRPPQPIDRRAKDALWHLAGLWARVMYVIIILNLIFGTAWVLLLAMGFLIAAGTAAAHH